MKNAPIWATLLFCAFSWLSCQTGGTDFQPIVIDLSARSPTPTASAAVPASPPPTPTPPVRTAPSSPAVPGASAAGPAPAASPVSSAEAVAGMRIDSYNQRSLDSLLSVYSPDARIFEPPDRLRDSGAEQIRQTFARRFSSPDWGRLEVTSRMVEGNYVVERETESRGEGRSRSAIVISEIRAGKIVNVWILR
jgi:hypothetical protein